MIRSIFGHTIVRYIFVGATAYLIEIGSLYYLNSILKLSALWSVAISFWIGFIVVYLMQKVITFQNHDYSKRSLTRELVVYSALVTFNYLFTLITVCLLEQTIPVILIRTTVIIITTIWNFLIYQQLFSERRAK